MKTQTGRLTRRRKFFARLYDDNSEWREVAALMPSPRPGCYSVITLRCGSAILLSGTMRQNATALGIQLSL